MIKYDLKISIGSTIGILICELFRTDFYKQKLTIENNSNENTDEWFLEYKDDIIGGSLIYNKKEKKITEITPDWKDMIENFITEKNDRKLLDNANRILENTMEMFG